MLSESFIAKNMIVSSSLWSNLYLIVALNIKDSTLEQFVFNFCIKYKRLHSGAATGGGASKALPF